MDPRPATLGDLDAIASLVERAYRRYVPCIGRRPAPMDDDYHALVAGGEVFVLDDHGGIAGLVVLRPGDGHLLVDNVAVDPVWQGQGLGRRLLDFAAEIARRRRLAELRLYTNETMGENIAIYQRLGWVEYDRREAEGFSRVYFRRPVGDPSPPASDSEPL